MPRFDKLLVLDLDETLIHATADPDTVGRPAEHSLGPYSLYRRPHVEAFLETARAWFDVAVWTSSSPLYAAGVVRWLGLEHDLRFLWASDRCTRVLDPEMMAMLYLKPLQKILRAKHGTKEKVLFVDDSPHKIRRSYGNYVRVTPFRGDPDDDELPALLRYLETLGPADNVRTIEKRGWRRRFP